MSVIDLQESASQAVVDMQGVVQQELALKYPDTIIGEVTPRIRVDYYTEASGRRVRAGGAMVVRVSTTSQDGQTHREIVVDDISRPFSEPAATFLGAIAQERYRDGDFLIADFVQKI